MEVIICIESKVSVDPHIGVAIQAYWILKNTRDEFIYYWVITYIYCIIHSLYCSIYSLISFFCSSYWLVIFLNIKLVWWNIWESPEVIICIESKVNVDPHNGVAIQAYWILCACTPVFHTRDEYIYIYILKVDYSQFF